MTILLPALAAAFVAFCVWLTVRIVNRRERWAKRTLAVVVGLPVLYVASFGPACWITSRTVGAGVLPTIYKPITWGMSRQKPGSLDHAIRAYAKVGANENWDWWFFARESRWLWEAP